MRRLLVWLLALAVVLVSGLAYAQQQPQSPERLPSRQANYA
jgi:hypothetical protein